MARQFEKVGKENLENTQINLRTDRLYVRVTAAEKETLRELAAIGGFLSISGYMREKGLSSSLTPTEANSLHWQWLGAVNRIGTELDGITAHVAHGREPDEEILLLVMQLHELAQETWREARAFNDGSRARND